MVIRVRVFMHTYKRICVCVYVYVLSFLFVRLYALCFCYFLLLVCLFFAFVTFLLCYPHALTEYKPYISKGQKICTKKEIGNATYSL